jgi:SAM-dependent methyltransferase
MPYCVICDQPVATWIPYPLTHLRSEFMKLMQAVGSDAAVYQCPHCGCTDRDRHLWLYLMAIGLLPKIRGARMLHIAPEIRLEKKFLATQLAEYVRGDLFPVRPGIKKVDVERMEFVDDFFDLIVCNHVMEHVSSPERALAEFFRCLKPGGVLIAQTPYTPLLKKTFEMHTNPEGDFRRVFYGQDDHVRLFGSDIVSYFHAAGFQGELYPHESFLGQFDRLEMGINPREPLFLFSKPLADAVQAEVDSGVDFCPQAA